MPQIVLTDEQARILQEAKEAVEVRDPLGRILSFLQPMDSLDAEAVSRFRRTRDQPRETIPAAKVQAQLRRLEEIRQGEGMDEAKMLDLLACRRGKRYDSVRRRLGQVSRNGTRSAKQFAGIANYLLGFSPARHHHSL